MSWDDITVSSKAPTRETRSSMAGIVLAIMYATNVMAKVQPNHVPQWFIVLPVECLDPGRMRTIYFANKWDARIVEAANSSNANSEDTFFMVDPADPRAREATYELQ